MKVDFKTSYIRDLKKIKDTTLLQEVKAAIEEMERAASLHLIKNLQPLRGWSNLYRVKVGEYRIGLKIEGGTIYCVRFLHRKEIYRFFP